MASIINATTASGGGLISTADASGVLQLQTGGTAAVTVDASQNVGISSTPPSDMAQYGLTIGAATTIQNVIGFQTSAANNAYWTGSAWKARATQNGFSAIRHNTDNAGGITIHSNSSAFTAGNTLTTMDTTDLNFALYPTGEFKLNKATGSITNQSGRPILKQSGSILQVVNATYATQTGSNSTTYVDTGLSATITPSSTSSKILVIVQHGGCGRDTNDTTLQLQLLRGATVLYKFETVGGWTASPGRLFFGTCGTTYLDSPATSSAVTYKTQQASYNGGANTYTQYNVGAGSATSTITLLEIAG